MLTNTYECLAIILRSLRLVANCIRKPIRLIFATFWRICREYFFLHSQGYSPQCETSIRSNLWCRPYDKISFWENRHIIDNLINLTIIFNHVVILTTIRAVCKCVLTNMSFSSRAAAIPLQSSRKFVYA